MKAIIKKDNGYGVVLQEVDRPTLRENEVLVKVEAASICGSDLHMYQDMSAYSWVKPPIILGHEFAGRVVETYSPEQHQLIGKPVLINPYIPCGTCNNCQRGKTNLCDYNGNAMAKVPAKSLKYGFREPGGMAEYVAVHERNVLELPEHLSFEIAGMLEAIGISVRAIERTQLLPGDSVAVLGPGPIGLSLIASLANYGLKHLIVTGLREDEERLRMARELGATEIIYADEVDAIHAVATLTEHQGVDYVFETSGFHGAMLTGVRMLTKGGELLLVGICAQESVIPTSEIVRGEITVKGVYGVQEQTLKRAIEMAASGKYPYEKLITHVLSLEQAEQGFQAGIKRESIKVILKP